MKVFLNRIGHTSPRLLTLFILLIILVAIPLTIAFTKQTQNTEQHAAGGSPCQFQKADQPLNIAFCDTFTQPVGTGNRSGDLNGLVWGVSRINTATNNTQGQNDAWAPTQIQQCGQTPIVFPDKDVVICNNQLIEAVNDGGSLTGIPIATSGQETGNIGNNLTVLAMYPKQPFDIAGRTGTVTFDVTADSQGGHAAWPTFVYTDQPVPAPYSQASAMAPNARNSFGFTLDGYGNGPDNQFIGGSCPNINNAGVGSMFITRNYALSGISFTTVNCVKRPNVPGQDADTSTLRGPLNHFEVRISLNHIEVWGTDPGSTTLKELAFADNVNMPLTRGLIWIEDVHYNACKFNSQCVHSFAWDNVGFDGPILPRDLATDALENNQITDSGHAVNLGWEAPNNGTTKTIQINGISNISQAAGAIVTFNWWPMDPFVPSIQVNGNPWHDTPWPFTAGDTANATFTWRTIAVPVPLTELTSGTNSIAFKTAAPTFGGVSFANVDIVLVGAGGTSTCIDPSSPCVGVSITPTDTPTPTMGNGNPTNTPTVTLTPTITPSRTPTPIPPTATNTPTNTPVPTQIPSPTITPANTSLSLVVKLHGLGNGGDNANASGGNIAPLHTSRPILVSLFNSTNQQVTGSPFAGTLTYDYNPVNQTGTKFFLSTINLPPSVSNGFYTVKVLSPGFLSSTLPSVISVTQGNVTSVPTLSLITADVNGDNTLDLRDYNMILNNLGSSFTSSSVLPNADITDDGVVDIRDLNQIIREFSVQSGN